MGTAQVSFAVDPCGGSTGSHMTALIGSDVSHVTGSMLCACSNSPPYFFDVVKTAL